MTRASIGERRGKDRSASSQTLPSDTARAAQGIPTIRSGVIPRNRLLARVESSDADVVAVIAGPGYGKTTLLAAVAHRRSHPVVWLSLDGRDDDPTVLLADLAFALDRVHPLEPALLQRLATSGGRVPATRIRDLTRAMEPSDAPVLVVFDDVHVLKSDGARDVISSLIEKKPPGWTVALASREVPDLSLSRLSAAGRLLELGDDDLAMDEDETAQLVQEVGLDLPPETISLIRRRTEGWPVAIYLATRSVRDRRGQIGTSFPFDGDGERLIADYVRDELLRGLPRRQFRFMTRTSILRELTPALCDAVVGPKGSGTLLAQLERSNPLVVPIAGRPDTYRYHQLFRDVLLGELRRTEPDLIADLNGRAAAWFEANGLLEEAIDHAQAGGDVLQAGTLICSIGRRAIAQGRLQTLRKWLAWFDEGTMLEYPPLVVITAWFHAFAGDEDPVRWLRIAESVPFDGRMPDGSSSYEGAVALLRAALCLDGPDRMRADLIAAAELDTPTTGWQVFHRLVAGEAALLLGETDRARTTFRNAAEAAGPLQAAGQVVALGELATIAADAGEWDEAHGWISQARSLVAARAVGDILSQPLTFAVSARVFARRGEPDLARKELVEAQKLRPASSFAIPSFSIRGRVQMARAYLALADVEGARTVLREARDFQAHRPNIGRLAEELDEVEGEIRLARGSGISGPATLSAAELRVLVMLPTHLSFRQIGERLFVSNNTVKSHAMSIYHKLGVSSRSQAVDKATELGLLDL